MKCLKTVYLRTQQRVLLGCESIHKLDGGERSIMRLPHLLEVTDPSKLNYWLSRFVIEVQEQDGKSLSI